MTFLYPLNSPVTQTTPFLKASEAPLSVRLPCFTETIRAIKKEFLHPPTSTLPSSCYWEWTGKLLSKPTPPLYTRSQLFKDSRTRWQQFFPFSLHHVCLITGQSHYQRYSVISLTLKPFDFTLPQATASPHCSPLEQSHQKVLSELAVSSSHSSILSKSMPISFLSSPLHQSSSRPTTYLLIIKSTGPPKYLPINLLVHFQY